jgi:hypothetical protein
LLTRFPAMRANMLISFPIQLPSSHFEPFKLSTQSGICPISGLAPFVNSPRPWAIQISRIPASKRNRRVKPGGLRKLLNWNHG